MVEMFRTFFNREDTFGLGICNGCQMMSHLRDLIPGASHWPEFVRNASEQFEARLVNVELLESPSIFFAGMAGSVMPIVNSHGEGRVQFLRPEDAALVKAAARYVDPCGNPTEVYPYNPNGSKGRPHVGDDRRRTLHDHDAASGTLPPRSAALLASGRMDGRFGLDAHVPQRPQVGRLIKPKRLM